MSDERQSGGYVSCKVGGYVSSKVGGNRIARPPNTHRAVADRVARHPDLRSSALGIDKWPNRLEVGSRSGLEVDDEALFGEVDLGIRRRGGGVPAVPVASAVTGTR